MVAGAGLLAASGMTWNRHAPHLREMRTQNDMLADSVKNVHAALIHQSLLLRGLQENTSSIPDTVRRYGAGQMMEAGQAYSKAIRKLEMQERDLNLQISALERDTEREQHAARSATTVPGAAGLLVLIVGAAMALVPARRVGA